MIAPFECSQSKLHKDFGYDDDSVIKALEHSMDELRKAKMDLPPPAQANEFPKKKFGLFVEPNFEAKVKIGISIQPSQLITPPLSCRLVSENQFFLTLRSR